MVTLKKTNDLTEQKKTLTEHGQKSMQEYIYQKEILALNTSIKLIERGQHKTAKLVLADLNNLIREYKELTSD